MASLCIDSYQDPVVAWFAQSFPRQHRLSADIAADLRRCPELLIDPPNKALFGFITEFAIGLAVSEYGPYLPLLQCLGHDQASRILTLAGYRPGTDHSSAYQTWRQDSREPHPARLFTAATRLSHVHCLLNDLDARRPDATEVARLTLRRWPDLLDPRPDETFHARRAFRILWASITSGFHHALMSYGPATPQVPLLDRSRCADLLLGTTVVEIKSGRLDDDRRLAALIRQILTYALLAPLDGHPVTHAAVYAVRYQRLLRYPVQELADRLAGAPVDLTAAGADLARVIRTARQQPSAA